MFKIIDDFLNNITMYRLVLYCLIFLLLIAGFLGIFNLIPYSPISIALSVSVLLLISLSANSIFAHIYKAPTNSESIYISALILALIITPIRSVSELSFLGWAAILTVASKFIVAINKKHIFNPVAFAVALTSIAINKSASWWIGNLPMLPFVIIVGFLIVRKIKRFDLVLSFLGTSFLTVLLISIYKGQDPISSIKNLFLVTPLFFFASIMLTEPLTTPPTRILRIIYGSLVGFLFVPQVHVGTIYFTPELALITGNIYSYLVSPKSKLILRLKEKNKIATDVYDYIFTSDQKIKYNPGQYMEWTESIDKTDDRGNRRYFTLASSPTENNLRIGVKFPQNLSAFKKTMLQMKAGSQIVASQLSGDFVLKSDSHQKYVFIAGGIGITPFRSMIKYLLDTNQKRDIILFYANKTEHEIVYQDIFEEARNKLNIKTFYFLTDTKNIPSNPNFCLGRISDQKIKKEVPDFLQRNYYLSGPRGLVTAFEETLRNIGVSKNQIKTDYFPGFV